MLFSWILKEYLKISVVARFVILNNTNKKNINLDLISKFDLQF